MGIKGRKIEMLTKQNTFICLILYACINVLPLSAMIITPNRLTIYQANVHTCAQDAVIQFPTENKFPIPYLFSEANRTYSNKHLDRTKSIKRQVHVQIPRLKYASKINLNLFPDLHQVASRKRIDYRFADDFTWFGAVDGTDDTNAILTVKGNAMYGNIRLNHQMYHISPISPPLHEIALMNYSNFPAEHSPIEIQPSAQTEMQTDTTPHQQKDDGSVIHLMVVYTQKAANESKNINALIQLAIDETNLSYEQSNIRTRLNLVHVDQVDYKEQDIVSDLKHLSVKNDGYMDEIHALRDLYYADIVAMIERSNNYCGVSYLNPCADYAFCVVSVKCATGYYSLGHEIGHLFGARHNPEADPQNLPYPYGHGYLYVNGWRTIMSYNNASLCPNGYCQRILHWSNPGIRFQDTYTGSYSTHNNSRVLNESSIKVANFRNYGNRFTISNETHHPIKIHSIVPSSKWIKIVPDPVCPFQIAPMKSQSFQSNVDWQHVDITSKGHIQINNDNLIQIIAVPSNPLTEMTVVPNEINCDKNITIKDIHINDCQNIEWRAFSDTPWISIIDGYRGKGNGIVRLRIDHNYMGNREGVVGVTAMNSMVQKNVKIMQAGNRLSIDMPLKVRENDGTLYNVCKISIPSKTTKPLKVKLSVSDASSLVLPEFVMIPVQEKSVCFHMNIQNNTTPDGPHIVSVTADSPGWLSGNVSMYILDDESEGIIYVGEDQAYETILSAIEDAAPESSILVLSGIYDENIRLTKPVHLCAANGPSQTIIKGNDNRNHTIVIDHNNVTVEGFTIIGADNYGQAGIYLTSAANNCVVKNNICGQDEQNFNYYGIYVNAGGFHTLSHNLCQQNKKYGIYLGQSNHNTIVKNTCQLNQRTGMHLTQSQNNVIYKNIVKYHSKYGLNLSYNSNNNIIFLNSFISNDCGNVYSKWSANTWQKTSPVNHSLGHGFLGNYFDDHPLNDRNEDGITDTFYMLPNNIISAYPLSNPPENYECETQIIDHNNQLISDERAEMPSKCMCAAGQTVLFQSSPERHGQLEWTQQHAQTGNICFVSPIQLNHQLILQLGKVNTQGIFTKAGQGHIIVGNGKKVNFPFCLFPGHFLIDTNEQFAFQVTNKSPIDYSIWIGGAHTHITPYEHQSASPHTWIVGNDATFRSIQSALDLLADFQTGKAVTLTVLPGTYTENIKIERPVSLISANGYTQTSIAARRSDQHVIHIQSDNVKIEGFRIYGANRNNASGLCIDRGVANCYIANNRMGMDNMHTNDYGIIIHASIKNTLIHNHCIANEKHGIWMQTAFMNRLVSNACFQNKGTGMYVTDSLLNHFTRNICENNGHDGIHLIKSSRNDMQFNVFATNDNIGLFMDENSFINQIYLNDFVLNQKHNVFSQGVNQWTSETKKTYQYSNNILTNHMGNYYGDFSGQDNDHNGLIDTPFIDNGMDHADAHALIRPYTFYEFIQTTPSVILAKHKKKTVKKKIISSITPGMEKEEQPEIPISKKEHQQERETARTKNFVKIEKSSRPIKPDQSMQPIFLFTDVPARGNRLKNLKGLVLNVAAESHHIAVYIHIDGKGWQSKPYPASPMTAIQPDGRWECDITTSAFDQRADIIVAVLYVSDIIPPTLMNAPVLPDTVFEKGIGFVRNER
jgi:parallel beta-helix repeat protein